MKFFSSLAVLCLGLCAVGAMAFPLDPTPYTLDNGGEALEVQNLGDEYYSVTKTMDGYLLVAGGDGVFYYADENGSVSKYKARNPENRTGKEKAFLKKMNRKKAFESHLKNTPRRLERPDGSPKRAGWVPTKENFEQAESFQMKGAPAVRPMPEFESHHSHDIRRFPVVLVQNATVKNGDSTAIHQMLNQKNFKKTGYVGSVRDYFEDQSSGMFVPVYDLYSVTVSEDFSNYVKTEYKLVAEVAEALRSNPSFDASLYDADGDDEVDALCIMYAGEYNAANKMGGFQYRLQWNPDGKQSAGNGKKFNSYLVVNQVNVFAGFVHEFSHTMGLADHYCVRADNCYDDFSESQYPAPGSHYWDVMATGMYANGRTRPPSYNAFERNFMGWLDYSDINEKLDVTVIKPLSTSNTAYWIPVKDNDDEWFVLENRQLTRWDSTLPAHGLLIWHIDYDHDAWFYDTLNDDPAHQRVDVVEAGNIKVPSSTEGFKEKYFVDDVFPGSQNVTKYGPFTSWSGKNLGVSLYNITDNGEGLVCFSLKEGIDVNNCMVDSTVTNVAVSMEARLDDYMMSTAALDAKQIADALGLRIDDIPEFAKYYGVDEDGYLRAAMYDGFPTFFDEDGNTCFKRLNDDSAVLYADLDLDMVQIEVGNVVGKVKEGDQFAFRLALVYGYNRVNFDVNVTFVNKITSSASIVVNPESSSSVDSGSSTSVIPESSSESKEVSSSSANVESSGSVNVVSSSSQTQGSFETANSLSVTKMNLSGHMLYIRSLYAGNRTFRLFDSQGRLLMTRSIVVTNETVDLSAYVGKGVFIAQLTIGSSRQTSVIRLK